MQVNQTNLEKFMEVYAVELPKAITNYPEEYGYPVSEVPVVLGRMKAAFERGSYNHNSRAIKATCKALGIKYTRREIEAFLRAV